MTPRQSSFGLGPSCGRVWVVLVGQAPVVLNMRKIDWLLVLYRLKKYEFASRCKIFSVFFLVKSGAIARVHTEELDQTAIRCGELCSAYMGVRKTHNRSNNGALT